ncbi:hypothetical protein ACQ4PT_055427 [Festuca glaucescens]
MWVSKCRATPYARIARPSRRKKVPCGRRQSAGDPGGSAVAARGTEVGGTWIPTFSTRQVSTAACLPIPSHHLTPPTTTTCTLLVLWDSPSSSPPPRIGRTPSAPTSIPSSIRAQPSPPCPRSPPRSFPAGTHVRAHGRRRRRGVGRVGVRPGLLHPATLFIVVNLVIGTIALTSRSHQRRRRGNGHDDEDAHRQHGGHQEPPFHHIQQQDNQYYDDNQQHHEQQYVPAPAPLARTSSVLDRLRSIGLYRFRSGDFPPEYASGTDSMAGPAPASGDAHHARSRSEPAPARR